MRTSLRRIGFALGCALASRAVAEDAPKAPSSDGDDEAPPACSTEMRLSGTVYDAKKPQRSFAMLHVRPDRAGEVYRVGSAVGGFTVLTIEPQGVTLHGDHGDCWLGIASATQPPASGGKPGTPPPPARIPQRGG